MEKFDVGIIGSGVAGSLAAYRIATKYPNIKTVLFDIGRPPGKRRRQLEGFFGAAPTGDGKLYINNYDDVVSITDGRKLRGIYNFLFSELLQFNSMKIINSSNLSSSLLKKLEKNNWEINKLSYIEWTPEEIHSWMKFISDKLSDCENVKYQFDTEIEEIEKYNDSFLLTSRPNELNEVKKFSCNKILLSTGRSGWRMFGDFLKMLGIPYIDNYSEFGIRIEMLACQLKNFNESHCILSKDKITAGPFCWNGSVIQEDHSGGLVISSFRSNEKRWESDKVSFSLTKKCFNRNIGTKESDRIGQLAFILANNRVNKEKLKLLMKKDGQISIIKEFDWILPAIEELKEFIPGLEENASYYVPTLITRQPEVDLSDSLQTVVDGVYLAGETTNKFGILSAAMTGILAGDSIGKEIN